MRIKNATFVTSVADYNKCLQHNSPEIAIAGKSNVGKSSFINMLTNVKKLAKTSSEPGRTRLVNYFNINNGELMLVDLPGYGFARVSDSEKENWAELIEGYFAKSENLVNVFVLVDVRHEPSPLDTQMVAYLHHYNIPFTIIATKGDKLSRAQINRQKSVIAKAFMMTPASIYVTSALNKSGVDEVLARIDNILEASSQDIDFDEGAVEVDE